MKASRRHIYQLKAKIYLVMPVKMCTICSNMGLVVSEVGLVRSFSEILISNSAKFKTISLFSSIGKENGIVKSLLVVKLKNEYKSKSEFSGVIESLNGQFPEEKDQQKGSLKIT